MQKVFLLTALAAGLLASCSEDEGLSMPSVANNNTIAFTTSQAKSQTRSGESITSINKFTVSAVCDDKSGFFSNEDFIYDNGTGVFQSQIPHYWPTTGTLSFYAISEVGSHTVDANNVPTYTYTDWAGEKDLVAATVKAGVKEIPYPLTFKHLTSQIYVSAEAEDKTEELTYKLVSVKLTAPSKGTYRFANTTGGVGTWVIDNTKTSEYSYDTALPMSFRQNGQADPRSCYWNILPTTDGKLNFKIEYQVLQNGKVITDFTGSNFKECTIDSPGLVAGKMYRYNFILTRSTTEEITFTLTMDNWADGSSTSITIKDLAESSAVDLGLPSNLKWAKGNLGAESETDAGLYYAWGETTGYAKGSGHDFNCPNYETGPAASITGNLSGANDAARVKLGGNWRMPTHDEFLELINNTTRKWVTIDGVEGYKFTAANGNYVFFPAASYYYGTSLSGGGANGGYYSSTYYSSQCPWYLDFSTTYCGTSVDGGYYGMTIRAVCN